MSIRWEHKKNKYFIATFKEERWRITNCESFSHFEDDPLTILAIFVTMLVKFLRTMMIGSRISWKLLVI